MNREPVPTTCTVPFRWRSGQVEFLLITRTGVSSWEFPRTEADGRTPDVHSLATALNQTLGLLGTVDGEPIGRFESARGSESQSVVAFLMEITGDGAPRRSTELRCRWCFPEEARVRIRRKPLRRLIDAALHRLAPHASR